MNFNQFNADFFTRKKKATLEGAQKHVWFIKIHDKYLQKVLILVKLLKPTYMQLMRSFTHSNLHAPIIGANYWKIQILNPYHNIQHQVMFHLFGMAM